MSIETRLNRIETTINPNYCYTCNRPIPTEADLIEMAERCLARYLPHVDYDRARALALLREDAPELAAVYGSERPASEQTRRG